MTQHEAQRANFGPSWPEVAGFGAAGPNKQFLSFPARENLKNVQVSRHLPCLPFSGNYKIMQIGREMEQTFYSCIVSKLASILVISSRSVSKFIFL